MFEQKLEETCEHLQIVTDCENLLRSRCACLEEELKEDKEKIKVTTHGLIHLHVNERKQPVGAIIFYRDCVSFTRQQGFM